MLPINSVFQDRRFMMAKGSTMTTGDPIDLVEILEAIRPHLAGVTQIEMAVAAGTAQPNISAVLSGARPPTLAILEGMATAAGGRLSVRFDPPRRR